MKETLSSKYDPQPIEKKWYAFWQEEKIFHSTPNEKEPYTIVIPPPNVTGVLHMGHILNNTIQDILIRRALMLGKNACWVPGTDHASIATEAKVVEWLAKEGKSKSDVSREAFLERAWDWKNKYGGMIIEQLKRLGVSCDWERNKFTMDDDMYRSVIKVFVDLYKKGHIYKGLRMLNYDPKGKTVLSDIEVYYKEIKQPLYYIRYAVENNPKESITIATVRPETIMADTAVCVHPKDSRYKHLIGEKALIPLINKAIPIIEDSYVDMEFGTGYLKITPAHDPNDYEIGLKHGLEVLDIFDDEARLNEKAKIFVGEDRFDARKKIVKALEEEGFLTDTKPYLSNVGFSERTHAVVEPRLSMQWFLKMDAMAERALHSVLNKEINLIPNKFINTYRHWMENIRDWCISRQLWWGQRIPAWYTVDGTMVVAETEEEALAELCQQEKYRDIKMEDIHQDEDVLDTWFSSWLWPISVFDGINHPDNKDINYYYPTSDLVTGPDILFFWVARMIVAGYEYRDAPPFRNVYLTGIIRDKLGRKMSKSLGNSPDPLELMDKYSADGVRMGILLSSSAGNDLMFDEALCEQGRNFCNKLWNAFRLIRQWEVDETKEEPEYEIIFEWLDKRLHSTLEFVNMNFEHYRISDALMAIYKFTWDDFCSWYLEAIKPKDKAVSSVTSQKTWNYFRTILQLLHPFMPFITEELWHDDIFDKTDISDSICLSAWPCPSKDETPSKAVFEPCMNVITELRNLRNKHQIPNKVRVNVYYVSDPDFDIMCTVPLIQKLAKVDKIAHCPTPEKGFISCLIGKNEFWVDTKMDVQGDKQKEELEKELNYLRGFLQSVNKKLDNERFIQNAKKEIVEKERQKQKDAEQKMTLIEKKLASLV